jgi:hypothetical protein
MTEEYNSLMKNKAWELVPCPQIKVVKWKWIYILQTKFTLDGIVKRHKARLVSKGISQQEGIDYKETFAPVAKINYV